MIAKIFNPCLVLTHDNSGPISTVLALTKKNVIHLEANIQQVQTVVGYMETTCLA
jgi:hypothetical protein